MKIYSARRIQRLMHSIVNFWVYSNKDKLNDVADGVYSLGETDLVEFVDKFKYTEDLSTVARQLFLTSSLQVLLHCIYSRKTYKEFYKTLVQLSRFASLNEYAVDIQPDDLLSEFPFEQVKFLLKS